VWPRLEFDLARTVPVACLTRAFRQNTLRAARIALSCRPRLAGLRYTVFSRDKATRIRRNTLIEKNNHKRRSLG